MISEISALPEGTARNDMISLRKTLEFGIPHPKEID